MRFVDFEPSFLDETSVSEKESGVATPNTTGRRFIVLSPRRPSKSVRRVLRAGRPLWKMRWN
jgi:hypothetical protein